MTPLLAANAMSLYKLPTIADGGWLALDLAASYRFWRWFAAEVAVSPMFPLTNAWGYPDYRLALTPGVRFDGGPVYATLGAPLTTGARFEAGIALGVGASFHGVYVGLTALILPGNLQQLAGLGLEVGYRFTGFTVKR